MRTVLFASVMMLTFIAASAQTIIDPEDFLKFTSQNATLTGGELTHRHDTGNTYYRSTGLGLDISEYAWLDSIAIKFGLTDDELALLADNRFLVTERLDFRTMGQALSNVYHRDLPLFITTDIILYALHASYDEILINIEQSILIPNLQSLITRLYQSLPVLANAYNSTHTLRTSIEDVDTYVTVAKSLIDNSPASPRYASQETVDALLAAIQSEQYTEMPLFSDRDRRLDFSQFAVRGHYADGNNSPLGPYFRCMMWCGRMDFFITPPPVDENEIPWSHEEIRRMVIGAVMLDELIDLSGTHEMLVINDEITTFMIGESDNLTPDELSAVRTSEGIIAADLLNDRKYRQLSKSCRVLARC